MLVDAQPGVNERLAIEGKYKVCSDHYDVLRYHGSTPGSPFMVKQSHQGVYVLWTLQISYCQNPTLVLSDPIKV